MGVNGNNLHDHTARPHLGGHLRYPPLSSIKPNEVFRFSPRARMRAPAAKAGAMHNAQVRRQGASRPVSRVLYGLRALRRGNVAAIHLGRPLPDASRNLPGRRAGNSPRGSPLAPPLFGLAPGGVYRAASVTGRAVGSYPTLSPLPHKMRGGLLSVALSLGLPPPAVSRHRVSMEPGLSSPAAFRHHGVRPPGRLADAYKGIPQPKGNRKAAATLSLKGRARRYAPSPCCNRRKKPGSSVWRHGRHCI